MSSATVHPQQASACTMIEFNRGLTKRLFAAFMSCDKGSLKERRVLGLLGQSLDYTDRSEKGLPVKEDPMQIEQEFTKLMALSTIKTAESQSAMAMAAD